MHMCRVQDESWKCLELVLTTTKMRALDYCRLVERQDREAAISVSPRLLLIDKGEEGRRQSREAKLSVAFHQLHLRFE